MDHCLEWFSVSKYFSPHIEPLIHHVYSRKIPNNRFHLFAFWPTFSCCSSSFITCPECTVASLESNGVGSLLSIKFMFILGRHWSSTLSSNCSSSIGYFGTESEMESRWTIRVDHGPWQVLCWFQSWRRSEWATFLIYLMNLFSCY